MSRKKTTTEPVDVRDHGAVGDDAPAVREPAVGERVQFHKAEHETIGAKIMRIHGDGTVDLTDENVVRRTRVAFSNDPKVTGWSWA